MSSARLRPFGPGGRRVPVVGQGTWKMGQSKAAEVAALRRGLELGLWHLDTAELYGAAEDVTGEVVAGARRDALFLVSKVLPQNATRRGTVEACERSLRRLRTDHLDVYLLHWRGRVPLEETMRGLEELVKAGKTRALGVSNFDVDDLEEAEAALGPGKLACNQVYYDLEHRGVERRVLPWCQARGVALVGYSPFGNAAPVDAKTPGGRVVAEVAARRGATVAQVTLAFLTRLEGTFTIPKASRAAHVEDNAKALHLELAPDDVAAIDRAFPAPARDGPLQTI